METGGGISGLGAQLVLVGARGPETDRAGYEIGGTANTPGRW